VTARDSGGETAPTVDLRVATRAGSAHRTAKSRTSLSRPVQLAVDTGLLSRSTTLFDYGCGRGDDLRLLTQAGYSADGWDPVSRPHTVRVTADVVNLGYVVNVIEQPEERAAALRSAWALTRQVLIVAGRLSSDMSGSLQPRGDGWLTANGTFQRFYTQHELRAWIDSTLDVESIAAAPGIFMVFRNESSAQSFLHRLRRRPAAAVPLSRRDILFERHAALLKPLMTFFSDRGRLPLETELPQAEELTAALGSIARAWQVVAHVTKAEGWDEIREQRAAEMRIHLALGKLRRRPSFSGLPPVMQQDVRALFGSYKQACSEADALLWGAGDLVAIAAVCRAAGVGKLTATDLYVHRSLIDELPPLLRVYEGCARWIAGEVRGSNIVKLAWNKPKVSYLAYPNFDRHAHPVLDAAVVVDLADQSLTIRDYGSRANPPILHRKELFVSPEYPGAAKFARLTRQEERWGLYGDTARIGTRDGWAVLLEEAGAEIRGHRVMRVKPGVTPEAPEQGC
jgi:DNA phosphorothioation-associated putative methyltransferase